MDGNIAVSISFNYNGQFVGLVLENVSDTTISDTSTITTHPIPTGDTVADSMFKQPITLDITGELSDSILNGQKIAKGILIDGDSNLSIASLQDIQRIFTEIKNGGILCDIVRIKQGMNNEFKFLVRQSMALQRISWTEKINTLSFTFSFQQVMRVNLSEDNNPDIFDANLPELSVPVQANFTDTFLDVEKVVPIITEVLKENGIVDEKFLNKTIAWGQSLAISGITAALAMIIVASIASAPLVLIIGAVAFVGMLAYRIITDLIQKNKSKKKIHQFRVSLSEKKTKAEIEEFLKMEGDILKELEVLNKKASVYQISKSASHQSILIIDNQLCCFTFTKNNADTEYCLTILDEEGKIIPNSKICENVRALALTSIGDCNYDTAILTTSNGYYVYLMNPNDSEERTNDLTENYLLVTSMDLTKLKDSIAEIIVKTLLRE